MTTIQLANARRAFLDEMLSFYTVDVSRRATVPGDSCRYRGLGGTKCAIGRYIPDEAYHPAMEGALKSTDDLVWSVLPVEIQALGVPFLRDVQLLHDRHTLWRDSSESTIHRTRFYDKIVKRYCTPTREEVGDPPAYVEDFIKPTEDVIQHEALENC